MDKNSYRGSILKKLLPYCVFIVIFGLVLSFVIKGLQQADESSNSEGLRVAENSINRAVINCYASEGMYPPNFEYLKEHYGISVDEDKYIVHYDIFASNIMPDITVIRYER